MNPKLTPVKFFFGDDPTYDGFTDGTTWNGFENIWVTKEVHEEIVTRFTEDYKVSGYEGDELAEAMESFNIEPDDDGLYSYAYGFATSIDEDADDCVNVLTEVFNDWAADLNLDDPDFEDKAEQAERQAAYDRARIALYALEGKKVFRCHWDEGFVNGPATELHVYEYFRDNLGFERDDRAAIGDLNIYESYVTGGPIETLTIVRVK
jgi:hypothetical protein